MASPVTVEDFKGLRLLPEQGEAGGAVSMLNADFTRGPTQVGTRGGLVLLGAGTASYDRIGGLVASKLLLFRNTGSAAECSELTIATGVVAVPRTWGSASTFATAVVVGPSALAYVAARSGAANENLKTAGVTMTDASPTSKPRYLAVTSPSRRLVQAHFVNAADSPSGANGTTSTVFFSDAATFTSYGATNWVKLDPDDGDEITGMATWRDSLFVLKRSFLYVFYGESIDTTGNPVFNFRKVTLPARARTTTNRGGENIVAGGDGVYLLLGDGVYRTTGDVPQMVSRDIAPVFDGTGDATMLFPATGDWSIGYATNRLYLSYTVGATYRTLVFDTLLGEWLLWDISAGASAVPSNVIEWVNTNGLPTSYVAAGANVFSLTKTATSDNAVAIVSSYQAGFEGLGYPTQEKQLRSVELVGSGSPTLTVLTDYATSDPLSRQATVTLGTAPAVAGATHAKSYRGRLFSFKLSATSGAWSVARVTWNVRTVRSVGLRSAA